MRYGFLLLLLLICLFSSVSHAAEEKEVADAAMLRKNILSQEVVLEKSAIKFKEAIALVGRSSELTIITAPDLCSTERLNMIHLLPKGKRTLEEYLDLVCMQADAKWELDENNGVLNISVAPPPVEVVVEKDPLKKKYSVWFSGITLYAAARDLEGASGILFEVDPSIKDMPIEISIQKWTLERILSHMEFVYDIEYTISPELIKIYSKSSEEQE